MTEEKEDLSDIERMISEAKKLSPKQKKSKKINNKREIVVTKHQNRFLNFVEPTKREQLLELLFSGSVGAGKSTALVLMVLKYAQVPNTVCLMLHLHLSSLKKSTLPLLIQGQINAKGEFIPPLLAPECISSFNRSDGIIYLTNGSKIILSGVGDSEKLKSINAHMAVIDELTNLKQSDYFSILQRCRLYHPLPNGVFAATNPSNRASWVYQYFVENTIPDYREMISVTSYSNKDNLPPAYLKSLENLPEQEKRKMLLGEWVVSGKEVFYCWDESKFTEDLCGWKKSDYDDFMLGCDIGGGSKYSGTCLIGRKDNIFHVLEEFSKMKTSHKDVLDWIEQYRHLTELVASDCANACFNTDLENNSWVYLKPNKDIESGVAKLNSLFSEGRIVVNKKCTKLIKELSSATRDETTNRWDKKTAEVDMLDSLRYCLVCFDNNELMSKNSSCNLSPDVFVFSL